MIVLQKFEEEIGHKVYHKYIVKNSGPWRARDVSVLIQWPIQLDNGREYGKWYIFLNVVIF